MTTPDSSAFVVYTQDTKVSPATVEALSEALDKATKATDKAAEALSELFGTAVDCRRPVGDYYLQLRDSRTLSNEVEQINPEMRGLVLRKFQLAAANPEAHYRWVELWLVLPVGSNEFYLVASHNFSPSVDPVFSSDSYGKTMVAAVAFLKVAMSYTD